MMMTFEQLILVLIVAQIANAAAGTSITVGVVFFQQRRHTLKEGVLNAKIAFLERRITRLVDILEARDMLTPSDAAQLRVSPAQTLDALMELFSKEDLEVLAYEVGIDLQHLGGDTVPVIAKRLLQEADRAGKYAALVAGIKKARPNANL